MSFETLGASTSEVEITGISAHGIWMLAGEEEMFLAYEHFPWFKDVAVGNILNVQEPTPGHFHWPDLDVDLGLETIRHPDRFPLRARPHSLVGMLHSEKLSVSGSGLSDLSLDRLKHHLAQIMVDAELPLLDEQWESRLCNLGFMTEREAGRPVCTVAGLVLFGHSPRRLLQQAGIRWMAFDGRGKNYKALDDRLIDGPLIPQLDPIGVKIAESGLIERLVAAMRPFISEELNELNDSFQRQREWSYPLDAVREALINALAHRDWTRTEEIEIVRYADRLEVLSPGALQNSMTVEKMIAGQRSPRNTLIVEALRDYGYVDARGMGVRSKIIPLLQQHNGTTPEFEATEDYLKIIMRRG